MSIDGPGQVSPGWYLDPRDSSGRTLRWWNGSEWSDHLSPLPQAVPQQPSSQLQFVPQPDPRSARALRVAQVQTTYLMVCALSFAVAGAVALLLLAAHPELWWLPVLIGIAAAVEAIIAIAVRRVRAHGRILLALIALPLAAVAMVGGLAGLVSNPHPFQPSEGESPIIYPHNPELTKMAMSMFTIERGIRSHFDSDHFPQSVVADATGTVTADGVAVGTIEPTEHIVYSRSPDGTDFTMVITGPVAGEEVDYHYAEHEIITRCAAGDQSCVGAYK